MFVALVVDPALWGACSYCLFFDMGSKNDSDDYEFLSMMTLSEMGVKMQIASTLSSPTTIEECLTLGKTEQISPAFNSTFSPATVKSKRPD